MEVVAVSDTSKLIRNTIEEKGIDTVFESEIKDRIKKKFSLLDGLRAIMHDKKITAKELAELIFNSPINRNKISKESIERKIRNWLDDKGINRDMAFELCILLKLDYETVHEFITKNAEHLWIHPRNYKDLIYDFCLRNKLEIQVAYDLIEEYSEKIYNREDEDCKDTIKIQDEYEEAVANTDDIDAFREFLDANLEGFGKFRRSIAFNFCGLVDTFFNNFNDFDNFNN